MKGPEALNELTIGLQMLAVSLVGVGANPQFVNPATLLANNVVDGSWVCEKGVQIGITESTFRYTNGVRVNAGDDTLTFRQFGDLGGDAVVLSPDLAMRFVAAFDADDWFAVNLEFGGRLFLPPDQSVSLASLWDRFSEKITHEGVVPSFSTNAFYRFQDRNMAVSLRGAPRPEQGYIMCSGSVRRNLDDDSSEEPGTQLQQVCTNWASDWSEVASIAIQLVNAQWFLGGAL